MRIILIVIAVAATVAIWKDSYNNVERKDSYKNADRITPPTDLASYNRRLWTSLYYM